MPAVILFDWFPKKKQQKALREREWMNEQETDRNGDRQTVFVADCVCVCVRALHGEGSRVFC